MARHSFGISKSREHAEDTGHVLLSDSYLNLVFPISECFKYAVHPLSFVFKDLERWDSGKCKSV